MAGKLRKLRAIRKMRGMTQEGLARYAGVTMMTVHRAEMLLTVPHRATRQRLARALRVSPGELEGRNGGWQ